MDQVISPSGVFIWRIKRGKKNGGHLSSVHKISLSGSLADFD